MRTEFVKTLWAVVTVLGDEVVALFETQDEAIDDIKNLAQQEHLGFQESDLYLKSFSLAKMLYEKEDEETIEELELRNIEDNNGTAYAKGVPTNMELMEKVNEIIRYLNGKVGKEDVNDIAPPVVVGAATTNRIGKVLALGFIDFLGKNRREGKMCLSNGECVDIEKAVREQDWKKLDRYMRKYIDENDYTSKYVF